MAQLALQAFLIFHFSFPCYFEAQPFLPIQPNSPHKRVIENFPRRIIK